MLADLMVCKIMNRFEPRDEMCVNNFCLYAVAYCISAGWNKGSLGKRLKLFGSSVDPTGCAEVKQREFF